jgi:NAD(P)-dependent dehydrogenase (short-subunit alcohol dehydrogenase family)
MADQALLLLFGEGGGLAVAEWFSTAQNLVNQLQDTVSHGYQRGVLLASGFGGDAPELLLQETVLSFGIRANVIAPGSILSPATRAPFYNRERKALMDGLMSHIPLHRPGKPEDIANAALYLASPGPSYVTAGVWTRYACPLGTCHRPI